MVCSISLWTSTEICSYDVPGVKTGPVPGVTSSKHRNKEGKLQNSTSLKLDGRKHLLVDLYQDCSFDAPGVKTGPTLGVTSLKLGDKEGKLDNSSLKIFAETRRHRALIFGM